MKFHISGEQDILGGNTTDVYFVRTDEILEQYNLDGRRVVAEFTTGSLPGDWDTGVFCGLDEVLHLLEGWKVDVWAAPEGTLFRPRTHSGIRTPLLFIEGSYGEFALYETPLLGLTCQASGIATRAMRVKRAARDKPVISFGIRRAHPAISPMIDRSAYIGGCDAVSSLSGAHVIDREPQGTMPHSLIILFEDMTDALLAYDDVVSQDVPRVALVDTYSDEKTDTIRAVEALPNLSAVRLDTPASRRGDMPDIVREVRWELDTRGHEDVEVFVSGGLDEHSIPPLVEAGAGGFGVGTSIASAPSIDYAMDIVELDGEPVAKRGKYGGRKYTYRCPGCHTYSVARTPDADVTCPRDDQSMRMIMKQYMRDGKLIEDLPGPDEIREYVLDQIDKIGDY